MARTYAKLKGSIWREDDWRALPASHQRLYMLLFSQPEISNCGVLPYLPSKWARMAADTTLDDVEAILDTLQRDRFICVDEDACELLIRTYVKHDQVAEQPKIRAAAVRQYDTILSNRIRSALAAEYPDVFHLRPLEQAIPEPYGEGYAEGYGEGYAVPTRVRARAANVNHQPPTVPTNHQPPAAPATNDNANAAAAIELKAAGWSERQIAEATAGRGLAVPLELLHQAQADPTCSKPGALAWTKYQAGETAQPPRTEIAPGATGTRSTAPPPSTREPEPEVKPTPPPADFLALAGRHTTHPPAPPEFTTPRATT